MQKLFLVLVLVASVCSESVRETETWMPMKAKQSHEDLVSSGDSQNGSDFEITSDDEDDEDSYFDDDDFSGSGDEESFKETVPTPKPNLIDNRIPEQGDSEKPWPTVNENDIVAENEVGVRSSGFDEHPPNVLMSQSEDDKFFHRIEVIAALIAGGAVGLLFSVLLILLLVYRMKKKDEGSYDLGKKPIYTKAATMEIYA
ncbi:syndecan-4 isoform X2 [Alosa pseudoharengus]|uniref:syndecan-4 isoform X2 n=1 Tax=Alosa sapidissima TaxID=34773 RepID=UPI001C0A5F42|nr:syndecan-4 isoform X2 [Alosa sapidissima]XP_048111377.1 syndecan-4 isoform X2 [Alosa alosa]